MTTPRPNATQLWRWPGDANAPLLTVGHGTLTGSETAALAAGAGVAVVTDVRRYPGSRRDPTVGQDVLAATLRAAGVGYRWEPRLGGRRHGAGPDNAALRHPAFRAYADYMETQEFTTAAAELLTLRSGGVAVLCSETLWWRCHRRLIADYATLVLDWPVLHLMHDGMTRPHIVTPEARLTPEGLRYPA